MIFVVIFVGGLCGSVEEKSFNENMELMVVIESENNDIRKRHVWKVLEDQDRVFRSYYAQRDGFDRGGKDSGTDRAWKEACRSRVYM